MQYTIHDNQLQTNDFIRLFASAGWGELPEELVNTALANSYATFSIESNGRVIAMARLLGDGAMSFFLKDLATKFRKIISSGLSGTTEALTAISVLNR